MKQSYKRRSSLKAMLLNVNREWCFYREEQINFEAVVLTVPMSSFYAVEDWLLGLLYDPFGIPLPEGTVLRRISLCAFKAEYRHFAWDTCNCYSVRLVMPARALNIHEYWAQNKGLSLKEYKAIICRHVQAEVICAHWNVSKPSTNSKIKAFPYQCTNCHEFLAN